MISRFLCLIAAGSLLSASMVVAQQPESAPPQPHRQIPQPTNLKVLPKDMTGQQVIAIMRGFEGQLGVECTYCHEKDPSTGHPNFASDANPMKDRARVMMRMTHAINTEYLTQLTDPKAENPVTCGTCHQGMPKPMVFVPKHEEHPEHAPSAGSEAPPSH